jgi:hypothetical protein
MQSYGAEIQGLTYNAALQAYQARVIFHEAGERITFPVDFAAPISADYATVSRGLALRARALRNRKRGANVARLKDLAEIAAHQGRLSA